MKKCIYCGESITAYDQYESVDDDEEGKVRIHCECIPAALEDGVIEPNNLL